MPNPESHSGTTREEAFARVVWSANILSHLSGRNWQRSQAPLISEDSDEEDSESECDSVVNGLLTASDAAIRRKFLDCLAETLSGAKGWSHVTATVLRETEESVEVVVARNSGKDVEKDDPYLERLQRFMLAEGKGQAICVSFEKATIEYDSERLKQTASVLKNEIERSCRNRVASFVEKSSFKKPVDDQSNASGRTPPLQYVRELFEVVLESSTLHSNTERLTYLASQITQCNEGKEALTEVVGKGASQKTIKLVVALARPTAACKLFAEVARRIPQFRNISINILKADKPVLLDQRLLVTINVAWQALGLPLLTKSREAILKMEEKRFRKDCSRELSTHAEIQLLLWCEKNPQWQPTLSYIGCSKKSCLLCATLIRQSAVRYGMRNCHGKLYPAWGIPGEYIAGLKERLGHLERVLVERISQIQGDKAQVLFDAVPESSMISSLKTMDVEQQIQKRKAVSDEDRRAEAMRNQLKLLNDPLSMRPKLYNTPSNATISEMKECIICERTPARRDIICRSCRYCSTQCQAADWPSHKLLCKKYAHHNQRERPAKECKRAIFFPQQKTKPSLVWVRCEYSSSSDDGPRETSHISHLLGKDDPIADRRLVKWNVLRGKNLAHSVEVIFRDRFLKDGSKPNRSIAGAIGSAGPAPHSWRGPAVVLRKHGLDTDPRFYGDISLADYRDVLDYFIKYADDSVEVRDVESPSRGDNTILGVKVACYGQQKLHGAAEFMSVEVPTRRFSGGETSAISILVGLPLKAARLGSNDDWAYLPDWEYSMGPSSNRTACMLFLETNIDSPRWGFAPLSWQLGIGDVLLVRADGKDLSVEQAELLCRFCRLKLQPLFEDSLGVGRVQRSKAEVIAYINAENMEVYKQELLRANMREEEAL